jgi:hypothetical protein
MRKFSLVCLITCLVSLGFGAVLVTEDFTSAQNGVTPTNWSGSYEPTSDIVVLPLASIKPAPSGDHTGGDGYALQVGDIGGGGYNWAWETTVATQTDCKASAWVYIDWTGITLERDYMIVLRMQTNRDPQIAPSRQAYFFLVTANSSWSGLLAAPTNFKPFLMKKVGTTDPHTMIGTEGTSDVTTGWHKMAVQIKGTELKGFIDDVLVCSGTDSAYASGYCAIGFYDDNAIDTAAAWDNFVYENTPFTSVNDWSLY